jgi:hypothetical protein
MNKDTILGIRDLDKHLAQYVDDKDVLNMIINKKYLELFDEQFFHNLLILKYPVLIQFKTEEETWKAFYIKMVYYLSKLKEEFNLIYIPSEIYNPVKLYYHLKETPGLVWSDGLMFAAHVGDKKLIEEMLSKGGNPTHGLMGASMSNNRELVEYFISIGAVGMLDLASGLVRAAEYGHKDLVDYFITKGVNPKYAVVGAAVSKDDNMFNYITLKYPVNLNSTLLQATPSAIKYLIEKGATNLNQALISFARRGALQSLKILISQGATSIEEARNAAAANGKAAVVEYLNSLLN